MSQHQGHGHAEQSVREDHYNGHHIIIKTSYDIRVDGKKFSAALGVSNTGNVQYHGVPNVGFASAVDLMRCVIDQFPEDFPKVASAKKQSGPGDHNHTSHDHAASGRSASKGTRKQAKPRVKKAVK